MKNFPDTFTTEHFRFVNYTQLTEQDSRSVWEARNHPEIRKWMVDQDPILWEDHQRFVHNLANRSDKMYYAVWNNLGGQF